MPYQIEADGSGMQMAVFLVNTCKFSGCGLTFPTLSELIQHIEETHIGSKFQCSCLVSIDGRLVTKLSSICVMIRCLHIRFDRSINSQKNDVTHGISQGNPIVHVYFDCQNLQISRFRHLRLNIGVNIDTTIATI